MNEKAVLEVRSRLERALRRKLYEAVWQHLLDERLVRDYLNGSLEEDPKKAWSVLKEVAKNRLSLWTRFNLKFKVTINLQVRIR